MAHARGHHLFEAADHEGGKRFLDAWLAVPENRRPMDHLQWHAALHDLALVRSGQLDEARVIAADRRKRGRVEAEALS